MIIFALAVLGLVMGSFANATIWRLHEQSKLKVKSGKQTNKLAAESKKLSILTGRSMCTHCGHVLSGKDLVPVVSYILLRGKCRYCGKSIEDTPVAELIVSAVFVISFIWWPSAPTYSPVTSGWTIFSFWLVFLVGFVILAIYDFKWLLLPDRVVFPLIALAVLEIIIRATILHGGSPVILSAVWGVVVIAGLFEFLYLISSQQWIGFGDVKLAVVLGLLVGGPWPAVLVIFGSSLLGSLAAIPLLVQGRKVRETHIPFGPFLLAATVLVVLWGNAIISWYNGLLGV